MIPYEIYKIIHLTSLIVLFTSFGVSIFGDQKLKIFKILSGVATLLILVSGMGLMARIGIAHGKAFPLWINLKFIFWGLIGIGVPVIIKRFNHFKNFAFWGSLIIFVIAATVANYKP